MTLHLKTNTERLQELQTNAFIVKCLVDAYISLVLDAGQVVFGL